MDGIIAIDAPGVRPGEHLRANLNDVAPTTLAMLGIPVPGTMDGRVLQEAFAEPLRFERGEPPVIEEDPDYQTLLAAGFGGECA
jgi:arylsulfatase A-like enzyme